MDLVISIINYKTKELTSNCIRSILNNKWRYSYKIWLVDNNSNDGSVEYLKKRFPKIKIIKSKKNLGFAGGHNLVLKKAKGRYFLILNSDTLIENQSLDGMIDFMDNNLDVGITSCKVLNFDGSLQPNGGDLPLGLSLINWLFNLESLGIKKPMFHRIDKEYYSKIREVGWVSGNFIIIRNEVLKKVGLFNEKYFMYFEDTELCYRVKKANYKIMINPNFCIKHISGGSLDDPKYRQWLGEYRGLLRFYASFGYLQRLIVTFLVYFTTILRILAFGLIGRFDYAKTYAKVITSI